MAAETPTGDDKFLEDVLMTDPSGVVRGPRGGLPRHLRPSAKKDYHKGKGKEFDIRVRVPAKKELQWQRIASAFPAGTPSTAILGWLMDKCMPFVEAMLAEQEEGPSHRRNSDARDPVSVPLQHMSQSLKPSNDVAVGRDLSYEVLSDVHIGCQLSKSTCTTYFCIHEPHQPCPCLLRKQATEEEEEEQEENELSSLSPSGPPAEGVSCATLDKDSDLVIRRRPKPRSSTRGSGTRACGDVITIHHSLQTVIDDVGLQVWRGALLLADFLLHKMHTENAFRDAVALELGAGTGLAGIVMARAARLVFLTDRGSEVLENCHRNVIANAHALTNGERAVRVRELDWDQPWPPPGTFSLQPLPHTTGVCNSGEEREKGVGDMLMWTDADVAEASGATVLLAADVVYSEERTDAFFNVVRALMPPGSSKVLYVALEKRYNFTIDDRDIVANGYDHFRSHFLSYETGVSRRMESGGIPNPSIDLRDEREEKGTMLGRSIDISAIPQRVHSYERGTDLELWEIRRTFPNSHCDASH